MSFEQWILLILSTAGSVSGALWVVAKVIIPRIVEARIEADKDRRDAEEQDRLHTRKLEDASVAALARSAQDATQQQIDVNRKLVEFLTDNQTKSNEGIIAQINKLNDRLSQVHGVLVRLEASNSIRVMDWSKLDEVLGDIADWMEKLDEAVKKIER